jgi:hypothetical protein
MNFDINYLAVLSGGLANMVIGFLWYGPLFSKAWVREMGWGNRTPEEMALMKRQAKTAYPQQFLGALIMAYVFAHVLIAFDSSSIMSAIQGAFWMWLGFVAPIKYSETLWGKASKKLFFIDAGYYLVTLIVMGIILTMWK